MCLLATSEFSHDAVKKHQVIFLTIFDMLLFLLGIRFKNFLENSRNWKLPKLKVAKIKSWQNWKLPNWIAKIEVAKLLKSVDSNFTLAVHSPRFGKAKSHLEEKKEKKYS